MSMMIAPRSFRPLLALLAVCIVSLGIGLLTGRRSHESHVALDRTARIDALVAELTTTPERQQRALDEIVLDGSGAYIYLLPYLDDKRPLATMYVRYLGVHPKRFERYSLIRSKSVGDALLRYVCWSTASCQFDYRPEGIIRRDEQRAEAELYIRQNFVLPSER